VSEQPGGPLQFEQAEYTAAPGATCSLCRVAIQDAYWEVGGAVVCERCLRERELATAQGGRLGRVVKATVLGGLAGAAGAAVWYAVRAATGYEIGLISILVGLGVGFGVRKGSGGRGGRGYQVLAVALTYAAIVSTYVPEIVKVLFAQAGTHATASSPAPAVQASAASPAAATEASPLPAETVAAARGATTPAAPPRKVGVGTATLALLAFALIVCAVALVAPFLGGFQNVMGIAIIGFGLWEAWKINKASPATITGPHRVGRPAA
jgi:hypothetical protein